MVLASITFYPPPPPLQFPAGSCFEIPFGGLILNISYWLKIRTFFEYGYWLVEGRTNKKFNLVLGQYFTISETSLPFGHISLLCDWAYFRVQLSGNFDHLTLMT